MEWSAIVAALIGAAIGSLGAQWLGDRQRRRHEISERKRQAAIVHLLPLQDALESLWFRLKSDEPDKAREEAAEEARKGALEEAGTRALEYYELSSLYVLANALAQIRLLVVDGAYADLKVFDTDLRRGWATRLVWRMAGEKHPNFSYPEHLERVLDNAEKAIGAQAGSGTSFYRYQRRGLADLMIRKDDRWRVLKFDEFAEIALFKGEGEATDPLLERAGIKRAERLQLELIQPAKEFVGRLGINHRQRRMIMNALQDSLWLIEIGTGVPLPRPISRAIAELQEGQSKWPRGEGSTGVEILDPDVMPMSDLRDWRHSRRSKPPKIVTYQACTILHADLIRPTHPPEHMIPELDEVIALFDELIIRGKSPDQNWPFKIETMGDGYLAACGAKRRNHDPAESARTICDLAIAMQQAIRRFNKDKPSDLKLRIGLHTGPLDAEEVGDGVAYLHWADTAREARRMARATSDNTIRCTEGVYELLQDDSVFAFVEQISRKAEDTMSREEEEEDKKKTYELERRSKVGTASAARTT